MREGGGVNLVSGGASCILEFPDSFLCYIFFFLILLDLLWMPADDDLAICALEDNINDIWLLL